MAADALDFEEITRPLVFEPSGVERHHRNALSSNCSGREHASRRVVNPIHGECFASVSPPVSPGFDEKELAEATTLGRQVAGWPTS